MIDGSDQFSLRGQLGLRAEMHFTLGNGVEIEPYLKIAVLHEFLTGDQITLDPTLSGDPGGCRRREIGRQLHRWSLADPALGIFFHKFKKCSTNRFPSVQPAI
jgi:hypothetical protein